MKPLRAVLVAVAMMFVAVLGGGGLAGLLLDTESPLRSMAGWAATTAVALAELYLYRRFVSRRPWSGIRLTWTWSAVPQTLLGVAVNLAAVGTANAVSVALGVAGWVQPNFGGPLLLVVPMVFALIVLGQAFPEEMIYRGHLYDTLSDSLSPRAVLAVTSVVFGSLHILSRSEASGVGERLLYVVMAMALGFVCGASRAGSGMVWMAIGAHSGLHLANIIFATKGIHYGVQLVIQAASMALAGTLILLTARLTARRAARRKVGAPAVDGGGAIKG